MKLILMRHGKSDWSGPTEPDHARPLNPRGRRSAEAMGAWLTSLNMHPDTVLCSDARRTQETWAGLGMTGSLVLDAQLYHATAAQLWDVVTGLDAQPCVLLIGHNPSLAVMAREAVSQMPAHPRYRDYPTCATAVLDFDIPTWSDARPGLASVQHFAIPSEVLVD